MGNAWNVKNMHFYVILAISYFILALGAYPGSILESRNNAFSMQFYNILALFAYFGIFIDEFIEIKNMHFFVILAISHFILALCAYISAWKLTLVAQGITLTHL